MKKFSKIVALVVTLVMCISMFAACGMFEKEPFNEGPKDAADLIAKSDEVMKKVGTNFQMDMTLKAGIAMDMEMAGASIKMDIPVELSLNAAIADKYLHGTVDMDATMDMTTEYNGEKETQSEDMDESAELYVVVDGDEITTYSKNGDEDWLVATEEFEMPDFKAIMDAKLFDKTDLVKTNDGYSLSVKFVDIIKNEDLMDSLENEVDLEELGVDFKIEDIAKVFGDATVTYKFDKEYRLVEISAGEIKLDIGALLSKEDFAEMVAEGMDPDDMDVTMEFSVKLSKFGEIKEDDVSVPKEVKDEAKANPNDKDEDKNDDKVNIEIDTDKTNPTTKPSSPSKISNNWKDYQFSIDGHVMSLPISYKDLKETTGYSMKSAEEKSYLEPGYYTSVQLRDAEGNGICYIDVLNNTDKDAAYADCVVIEIGQTDFQQEDTLTVKFAGGLDVGDVTSKEELISLFGEPTDIFEYRVDEADLQKYNSDTYTWSEDEDWTTRNYIEIEININTGVIQEIYIDHSNF